MRLKNSFLDRWSGNGKRARRVAQLLCAGAALVGVGCAMSSSRTESAAIRQTIIDRIDHAPDFGPHEITVEARDGHVMIEGTVGSERDRTTVEDIARTTAGVKEVTSNIGVRPRLGTLYVETVPVERIRQRIRESLGANKQFDLQIESRGGVVKLRGLVPTGADRRAVVQAIREIPGVTRVNDADVSLYIMPSDRELESRIRSAFYTDNIPGADNVTIAVNDGIATLAGVRSTHGEIDRILSVATMVDGVKSVRSDFRLPNGERPTR